MSVPSFGRLALALCLASLAGCAALPAPPPAHYIMVHQEGAPINREKTKLTPEEFKGEYLDRILAGIAAHVGTDDGTPAQVMLFVHGGLNTYEAGLERVDQLVRLDPSSATGDSRWGRLLRTPYYPVFVNWNSSLWSSLWDDIFIVRREQRAPFKATATAPVVLLSRVAEAGLSIPRTLWSFVESEGRPKGSDKGEEAPDKGLSYALLAPIRGFTVPFLDAFGTGAWDIMKRRAAFVTARGLPAEAVADLAPRMPKRVDQDEQSRRGAGRTLVQSLVGRLCAKEGDPSQLYWTPTPDPAHESAPRTCKDGEAGREVKITLVGHSMGALVVSRMLLGFPNVPFHRIVFLGAAASIDDLDTGVLPYLDRHPKTEFHNVSLSMNDERYEQGWGDLWERGSLLVWIDNLFERIHSPHQLRLGRCLNLFRPAPDEPKATSDRYPRRVFFHKLSGLVTLPRRHGDFDEPLKLPRVLDIVDGTAPHPPCEKPPPSR